MKEGAMALLGWLSDLPADICDMSGTKKSQCFISPQVPSHRIMISCMKQDFPTALWNQQLGHLFVDLSVLHHSIITFHNGNI